MRRNPFLTGADFLVQILSCSFSCFADRSRAAWHFAGARGSSDWSAAPSTAVAAAGGAPGASLAATHNARPRRNGGIEFSLPGAKSRSSTRPRNPGALNVACRPHSASARAVSTMKSSNVPTASSVASRSFHQVESPATRAASASSIRRFTAAAKAPENDPPFAAFSTSSPPNAPDISCSSIPHVARTVVMSSSSSATYALGSSCKS